MTTGIEVYGESGAMIMNQNSLNSRAVYRTRSRPMSWLGGGFNQIVDMVLPFPYLKDEVPVILARPDDFGKYIGSSNYSTFFPPIDGSTYGTGCITIQGQCPFEIMIFSTKGVPLERPGNPMFEVYDAQGNVTFSDKYMFPRLRKLIHRPATAANTNWPMSTSISGLGFTGKPWFLVGPLFLSGKGMGEFTEQGGSTCMAVMQDGVTVNVQYRYDGPASEKYRYDPYANRQGNFWVADVTGT